MSITGYKMDQLTLDSIIEEKPAIFTANYCEINEQIAERSHYNMSMWDYEKGSATAEYRSIIDGLVAYVNTQATKKALDSDKIAKVQKYLNKMSKFYADYINKDNEIGTRCPSVLISGAANFPTRKKEKQVSAWEALHKTYITIESAKYKINSILSDNSVSSDDPHAIDKLKARLANLEEEHKKHLESNRQLKKAEGKKFAFEYSGKYYFTDNETATIRRLKARIAELEKQSEKESKADVYDGFSVEYDNTDQRIRFVFADKPDEETREILKHNGFHWSRTNGAWQRLWNSNGEYATKQIIESIQARA